MTTDTMEPDEALLTLLEPIVAFMISNRLNDLRIQATSGVGATSEVVSGHVGEGVVYCAAEPGPGLHGIYVVADEAGGGRLDGPSDIPREVLHPLLKALDERNVEQLHITTVREAAEDTEASQTVVLPNRLKPDEFDEDVVPDPRVINAVIAFRLEQEA